MKTFKPENPKFKTERFTNPLIALVLFVLFILNGLEIDFLNLTLNTRVLYGIVLAFLIVYFIFKTIINLFYKITISNDFITFYYPFGVHNKRVSTGTVNKAFLEKNYLILLLSTKEAMKIGLSKYSKDQRQEILSIIKK